MVVSAHLAAAAATPRDPTNSNPETQALALAGTVPLKMSRPSVRICTGMGSAKPVVTTPVFCSTGACCALSGQHASLACSQLLWLSKTSQRL